VLGYINVLVWTRLGFFASKGVHNQFLKEI